jgi:hypothetical protein
METIETTETSALSRLERIHVALERVYDCLDHPGGLSSWQVDFLNSLVKQLHRGLTLTPRQDAVLGRIERCFEGIPHNDEGEGHDE